MFLRQFSSIRRRVDWPVVAILLCAAAVRMIGLGFGQPHPYVRPDETHVASIVSALYTGAEIHTFNYPLLFMGVITIAVAGWLWLGRGLGYVDGPDGIAAMLTDAKIRMAARTVSACAGAAGVGLVFVTARRLFGRDVALVSAACLAVAFLHVRDSHFGVTDVAASTMALAAFYYTVRLDDSERWHHLALAGITAGLAAATKYNMALIAVPACFVILFPATGRPSVGRRLVRVGAFIGLMAAGFFVGSPQAVLQYRETLGALAFESNHLAQGHGLDLGRGWTVHLFFTLRYGLSLPLFAAAIAGGAWLVARDPRRGVLVTLFPLAYYVVIGSGRTVFARYMVPVVPFLCMCAGYGIVEGVRWMGARIRRPAWQSWMVWPVTACLAAPSVWAVAQLDSLLSRTDTRVMAAQWIAKRYQHARIAHVGPDGGEVLLPARDGSARPEYPVEALDLAGPEPDIVVVQSSPLQRAAERPELAALLARRYTMAVEFSGVRNDPRNVYDLQDEFYLPFAGFYGVQRPGPNLRIYELQRGTREGRRTGDRR